MPKLMGVCSECQRSGLTLHRSGGRWVLDDHFGHSFADLCPGSLQEPETVYEHKGWKLNEPPVAATETGKE